MKRENGWIWRAAIISALFVGLVSYVPAGIIQAIIPAAVPTVNKVGNSSAFQLAGTVAGTGAAICTDANQNTTTSGCTAGASTLFSSTTNAGPNNTAAETSLIGTATGSKTIAANTFTDGLLMEAMAQGFFSLPATADALTLKFKCGSTVIGSASFTPAAGVLTNGTFRAWLRITARGTAGAGAFMTNGLVELSGSALTSTESKILNTTAVAFDFTTSCAFDITAQWGAAQIGELMTGTNCAAWFPGSGSGGGGSPATTNLTGTLGALPAAGTAGRTYLTTDSLFTILRDDGAAWQYFINGRQLTAKPSTTSVNLAGPAVTLTAYGPGARLSTTGAGNFNVAALLKAPAAATFTFTIGVISNQNPNGSGGCGLALSLDTNSAHAVITFGTFQYAGGGLGQAFPNANLWSNFTGTSAGSINNSAQSSNVSMSPIYFRVTEDVTNRTYFVSQDNGVTFQQWFQEAVGSHFTTGDIGVYYLVGNANTLGGSCTFVDWVES